METSSLIPACMPYTSFRLFLKSQPASHLHASKSFLIPSNVISQATGHGIVVQILTSFGIGKEAETSLVGMYAWVAQVMVNILLVFTSVLRKTFRKSERNHMQQANQILLQLRCRSPCAVERMVETNKSCGMTNPPSSRMETGKSFPN